MINFDYAKREFFDYTKAYDSSDDLIALKVEHTLKVTEVCQRLAKDLNFSKEDTDLAKLIGLLHDIGRFEQIRRFHTLCDADSIDHAEFGIELLLEEGLIRRFVSDFQYDDIIKVAISNHNKYEIVNPYLLSSRELLFCQLIRDADKADIFRVIAEDVTGSTCVSKLSNPYTEDISDVIYQEFFKEHSLRWDICKTPLDFVVAHFALLFDFNFQGTIGYLKEQDYISSIFEKVHCTKPICQGKWTIIQEKVLKVLENNTIKSC